MPSIQNPNHGIPEELAVSIRGAREVELASLARQDEISKLARSNEEERRQIAEIREAVSTARGMNPDMRQRLRDIGNRKFKRVKDAISRESVLKLPFGLLPWEKDLVLPEPADPTFWWARTDWSHSDRTPAHPDEGSAAHFTARMDDDGLRFTGGVTTHNGDLFKDSFGAVALFELQADRIPTSRSRRWRSTPHVELFGGLLGYTGDDDIFTGDLWSKCWMHRDQQLFQFGFGPDGPVPILLGQAHEVETLIFEEDKNRSVHAGLRGFQWMPVVTIDNLNPANSLWARIEVRFDIQTEGAGTLLWLDPAVLLRTFQWPLAPL